MMQKLSSDLSAWFYILAKSPEKKIDVQNENLECFINIIVFSLRKMCIAGSNSYKENIQF